MYENIVVGSKLKLLYCNFEDPKDYFKNKLCEQKSYGFKLPEKEILVKQRHFSDKMPLHMKVSKNELVFILEGLLYLCIELYT